jgi:hypothetical protein
MSVEQHLRFVAATDDHAWREHLLAMLALDGLRRARPEALSGGERVRLGLARALAGRPSWLLLDEPLAFLDAEFADVLREALPPLVAELSATCVLVSHEADDLPLFGERVLCLGGDGTWWLGDARRALDAPPTPLLAAMSGRGTLLRGIADAGGRVDFGMGLALDGQPAGRPVAAWLEASALCFAGSAEPDTLAGVYVAPDRRGGSWVRVGGRLLRCGDPHGELVPGAAVALRLRGMPRVLRESSAAGPS